MSEPIQPSAVQQFIERVQWLHEPDYGDFKRKVGLYLIRLEQNLGREAQMTGKLAVFDELRETVIYRPSGDVESTRLKVLALAKKL